MSNGAREIRAVFSRLAERKNQPVRAIAGRPVFRNTGCALEPEPFAVLAPWRRGNKSLPTPDDVARILSRTTTAFASADPRQLADQREELLARTPLGTSVRLRSKRGRMGLVRLRRTPREKLWRVDLFGPARHLSELAA